jgi:phytoene synthase
MDNFDLRAHLSIVDPARTVASLYAAAGHREALWTLYALHHELAKAEGAGEAIIGHIRLQWWQDVMADIRRGVVRGEHPLCMHLVHLAGLPEPLMTAWFEARHDAMDTPNPDADQRAMMARGLSGGLMVLAGRLLGAAAGDDAALFDLGTAWGLAHSVQAQDREQALSLCGALPSGQWFPAWGYATLIPTIVKRGPLGPVRLRWQVMRAALQAKAVARAV